MSTTRSAVIRWAASGLHACGLLRPLAWCADHASRRPVFQVLTYHRVNDDNDPFFPSVPTAVFERHVAYIARTYEVMTVETLAERMRAGQLPRHAVAITFDDGYRDNLTHAAPILARHGVPATIFLATGFIGGAGVPWVDRLALAFKSSAATSVVAPWGETLTLTSVGDRLRSLDRTLEWFKTQPDEAMRQDLERLLETLGVTATRGFKDLMLSWDDVHALAGLGFSIGAHTVNHPILSRVSAQRARTEILGARTMIESTCGVAPRAFAYPNGRAEDYTAGVVDLVREAGFTCAVTTRFGVNHAGTSPWELRRGGPWESHVPTFGLKLAAYRLGRDEVGA